jgi:hypothetical protein
LAGSSELGRKPAAEPATEISSLIERNKNIAVNFAFARGTNPHN